MRIGRISAFSISDQTGGNPAGVVICDAMPPEAEMQRIAADVGYSETVFACPQDGLWRVRYFSPVNEVPFCSHATIALGAVLAQRFGSADYRLQLNGPQITVAGTDRDGVMSATLTSPPPSVAPPPDAYLQTALALFDLSPAELDPRIPPAIAAAGARHLVLALKARHRLAAMRYDLATGQRVMAEQNLITIMLVQSETDRLFHARNPFASGGVYEDPATGAAAAAFGGYLARLGWPHGGHVTIRQGEDMGIPSEILVDIADAVGSPVRVGGQARIIQAA